MERVLAQPPQPLRTYRKRVRADNVPCPGDAIHEAILASNANASAHVSFNGFEDGTVTSRVTSHSVKGPVYTCGYKSAVCNVARDRITKRMKVCSDTRCTPRLPILNADDAPERRWRDFDGLVAHDTATTDLYFITNSAQLVASLRAIGARNECNDKELIGQVLLVMPVTVVAGSYLIGLRRSATRRLCTVPATVSFTLPAHALERISALCVSYGNTNDMSISALFAYFATLMEYCASLERDGHVLLAELVATLHLYEYIALKNAHNSFRNTIQPVETKPDDGRTEPNMTASYRTIIRYLIDVFGDRHFGECHADEVLHVLRAPHDAPYCHTIIPLKDARNRRPRRETPKEMTPDGCVASNDAALMIKRNYDMWKKYQTSVHARHIVPLPEYIPQDVFVRVRIIESTHTLAVQTSHARRTICKLGASSVLTPAFFEFVSALYECGVRIDLGLLTCEIVMGGGEWLARLPLMLRDDEHDITKIDARERVHKDELSFLEAIASALCADFGYKASSNGCDMMRSVVLYRISCLRGDRDVDIVDLPTFWRRVSTVLPGAIASSRTSYNAIRKNLMSKKRVNYERDITYTIAGIDDGATPAEKSAYVGATLKVMDAIICAHGPEGASLLVTLNRILVLFETPGSGDGHPIYLTEAIGEGPFVQALTMFWQAIASPEVGYFEAVGDVQGAMVPTRLLLDSPVYTSGLVYVTFASIMYGVTPSVFVHPYVFFDGNANLSEDVYGASSHPLMCLMKAYLDQTCRKMLECHYDVLFHSDSVHYLDYADSHYGYTMQIAGHVTKRAMSVVSDRVRTRWRRLVVTPLLDLLCSVGVMTRTDATIDWSIAHAVMCRRSSMHPCPVRVTADYLLRHAKMVVVGSHSAAYAVSEVLREVIRDMNDAEASKLMQFICAKTHLGNKEKVTIKLYSQRQSLGETVSLPTATTCMKTMSVEWDVAWTRAECKERLRSMFAIVLEHCMTFGLL